MPQNPAKPSYTPEPAQTDNFARVTWEPGDIPVSEQFGDTFFNRQNGRAETRHIFLGANHLPQRWQTRTQFTIAELGFGTGLNFLETLAAWQQAPGRCEALKFVTFERFPMTGPDIARALSAWPDLTYNVERLLQHWPPAGQKTQLSLGNATLELHLGDANERVPAWAGLADTWYLDGFSPAKNPELWQADLLAAVYQRTSPGGTFATYTSAGWVRRNLTAAGFEVVKTQGYGRKRDSLAGRRPA